MKVQKNIEVRLVEKRLPRPIDLVQYDTGIQLVFSLLDFNIPENTTATLYVQKPSGMFVFQETGIVVEATTITIDLENQALTEHGNNIPYQVQLKNGSDLLTTFAGIMRVEKSLANDGAMKSKTVIAAFEAKTAEQIAQIEAAAKEVISDAEAEIERKGAETLATIPEDYTQVQSDVKHLFDNAANGIKGNVSGAVVAVDDVSPVEHTAKVKVSGKNLLPVGTINFTKNKNLALENSIPAGTYTISALITSSDTDSEMSAVSINSGSEVMKYISLKRNKRVSSTFTVEKPITNIDFCAAYNYSQGADDTAEWSDVQLEAGDTATEYTPYIDPSTVTVTRCGADETDNPQTYTPAADGTVSGLTSLSPNMTILTDTDGVTVECEYIKDTNKVIAKLVNAISDLGGNVSI